MKKLLAIVVLFAVLFSVVGKTMVLGWYLGNKAYIAAVLCENKAKPKMKCNGKCQLAKQLKKAEGENKEMPSLPSSLKEVKDWKGNVDEVFTVALAPIEITIPVLFTYSGFNQTNSPTPLLRPPIV